MILQKTGISGNGQFTFFCKNGKRASRVSRISQKTGIPIFSWQTLRSQPRYWLGFFYLSFSYRSNTHPRIATRNTPSIPLRQPQNSVETMCHKRAPRGRHTYITINGNPGIPVFFEKTGNPGFTFFWKWGFPGFPFFKKRETRDSRCFKKRELSISRDSRFL